MSAKRGYLSFLAGILFFGFAVENVHGAAGFLDGSFENYSVATGQFVGPTSGAWVFHENAGVTKPYAPNTFGGMYSDGRTVLWSATFAAVDGQQYASTYAGGDYLRQTISFSTAGNYRISVYAAAPSGTVETSSGSHLNLASGAFNFTLGNTPIGASHSLAPGTSWTQYSQTFSIPSPGDYQLGVSNITIAPYFINYDAFAITPIPEPSCIVLLSIAALASWIWRRRRA
jgi:hypothetical protein